MKYNSAHRSRLGVVAETCNEFFSVYRIAENIIATASKVEDEGYWEVVLINEKDEQDVRSICVPDLPSESDITVFHNHHFNLKEQDTGENGEDED
jgi:hypothetical protein